MVLTVTTFVFPQTAKQVTTKKILKNKVDSIKIHLQGAWFGKEYDEHATFYIKGDTISYIEHFEKYKYLVSNDTLHILTKALSYKEFIILKLSNDSLILQNKEHGEVEIEKYWQQ